ncbi:hypothetical protein [Streptomyces sp. NPDC051572]|uniref:hypothetical protein n=1 Tax=unclassified Streptomyces TaxID=2593676 RepID=UPI00344DD0CB
MDLVVYLDAGHALIDVKEADRMPSAESPIGALWDALPDHRRSVTSKAQFDAATLAQER